MSTNIKEMQATIKSLQQQLDNLKEEVAIVENEQKKVYGSMIDKSAATCYRAMWDVEFNDSDQAYAYEKVFDIIYDLRTCEGSGVTYSGEYAFVYDSCIGECVMKSVDIVTEEFSLFPPFPTEELAQAALDKVGKDNVVWAMKYLAGLVEE